MFGNTCLALDGGDDVVDRLEGDGGGTLFAGPVRPVLQRVDGQHVAHLALEAEHRRHIGPHLCLVTAPRAQAVEEPVSTNVLATAEVTWIVGILYCQIHVLFKKK